MKTNHIHVLSINKTLGAALLSLGLLALLSSAVTAGEAPRNKLNINPVWHFTLYEIENSAVYNRRAANQTEAA